MIECVKNKKTDCVIQFDIDSIVAKKENILIQSTIGIDFKSAADGQGLIVSTLRSLYVHVLKCVSKLNGRLRI